MTKSEGKKKKKPITAHRTCVLCAFSRKPVSAPHIITHYNYYYVIRYGVTRERGVLSRYVIHQSWRVPVAEPSEQILFSRQRNDSKTVWKYTANAYVPYAFSRQLKCFFFFFPADRPTSAGRSRALENGYFYSLVVGYYFFFFSHFYHTSVSANRSTVVDVYDFDVIFGERSKI